MRLQFPHPPPSLFRLFAPSPPAALQLPLATFAFLHAFLLWTPENEMRRATDKKDFADQKDATTLLSGMVCNCNHSTPSPLLTPPLLALGLKREKQAVECIKWSRRVSLPGGITSTNKKAFSFFCISLLFSRNKKIWKFILSSSSLGPCNNGVSAAHKNNDDDNIWTNNMD